MGCPDSEAGAGPGAAPRARHQTPGGRAGRQYLRVSELYKEGGWKVWALVGLNLENALVSCLRSPGLAHPGRVSKAPELRTS